MKNNQAIDALRWVVNILDNNNIPYQIEGGLAAICYGATRELADIDIFIPNFSFEKISSLVKPYSQFGPDYYISDNWKLIYQILDYKGQ